MRSRVEFTSTPDRGVFLYKHRFLLGYLNKAII